MMIHSLNALATSIHRVAREKGWWRDCADHTPNSFDPTMRNLPETLALIHSEVSEALEDHRDGLAFNHLYFYNNQTRTKHTVEEALEKFGDLISASEHWKPCGVAIELVDAQIRIFDLFGAYDTDVDLFMSLKRRYNEHRAYRHGGKTA